MIVWLMSAVLSILLTGLAPQEPAQDSTTEHRTADNASDVEAEWQEYRALAYAEYSAEFDALFNGYETKWSKNGRLMMRTGDSGPYRFVKRTA